MEVALFKGAGPGDRDRAWLTVAGMTRRGPVHVVHDLPHLAVESLFSIDDGVGRTGRRRPRGRPCGRGLRRHKQGRIVSGAAASARTGQWLTPGHRRAKAITNCVTNRWDDGPDTLPRSAAGPPGRATRHCKTCWGPGR